MSPSWWVKKIHTILSKLCPLGRGKLKAKWSSFGRRPGNILKYTTIASVSIIYLPREGIWKAEFCRVLYWFSETTDTLNPIKHEEMLQHFVKSSSWRPQQTLQSNDCYHSFVLRINHLKQTTAFKPKDLGLIGYVSNKKNVKDISCVASGIKMFILEISSVVTIILPPLQKPQEKTEN